MIGGVGWWPGLGLGLVASTARGLRRRRRVWLVAVVLAVTGRRQLKSFDPQLPKTTQTLKEDVQWAKTLTD